MDFKNYIDNSWAQHDLKTEDVIQSYDSGLALIQTGEEVLAFNRLVSHVAIEHNFKFAVGVLTLQKLLQLPCAQTMDLQAVIKRQISTLKYIQNQSEDVSHFSVSDRTMIFISAAVSFLMQNQLEKAEVYLNNAVAASHSLKTGDPAYRTLAMMNNNMATQLGERTTLTDLQEKVMIETAQYARRFWEKAGTWFNVERAEYRLSQSYLKIADLQAAEHHARLCLQICEKENAPALEMFFAHELFVLIAKARSDKEACQKHLQLMRNFFNQCSEQDQGWMKASLQKAEA